MMKRLFEYFDYRRFLEDYCEEQKATTRAFSTRFFAKQAGFASPSYLSMVIKGTRNLSEEGVQKFVKALKLTGKEAQFFESLVMFNQAKSEKIRDIYMERLVALKPSEKKSQGLRKEQYEYFRFRYFVIIREMVALPHFKEDVHWIASRIKPSIRPHEAKHAIDALLKIGLLARDGKGRLIQSEGSVSTPSEVDSWPLFNLHREWMNLAKEKYLTVKEDGRDYTALTIPIPKKRMAAIKKKIAEFRSQILDYLNTGEPDFSDVYQMNIQLFPLTDTEGDAE